MAIQQDERVRSLRERWRQVSLTAGWPFPSDWGHPAVDRACAAALDGSGLADALRGLGAARAEAGVSLAETLRDLGALHTVWRPAGERPGSAVSPPADPDAVPARLLRLTSLGWADVLCRELGDREVVDALTGLPTLAYLRTRLGELYRAGAPEGYTLVVVRLAFAATPEPWPRMVGMVLAGDVLRLVFDSGETLAVLGPSTAAVLARRDDRLPARLAETRQLLDRKLTADAELDVNGPVRVHAEQLPEDHASACALLARRAQR